jgi:4-diphosphocytidyl-2-C-methyl-D-erythritol kinase
LIYPGFGVSTAEVFKNYKMGLTNSNKKSNKNLFIDQKFNIDRHLRNDLETVTAARYPAIGAAKEALLRHGARGALMSGSGPTVFGLFDTAAKARQAQTMIAGQNAWRVILANLAC